MKDQDLKRMARIAGFSTDSVVDGPGIRSVVFFQGCPHHCHGCHNPQTWSVDGGKEVPLEQLVIALRLNSMTRGVTLSGGDPFYQAEAAAVLAAFLRQQQLDIWVYTGYNWEEILSQKDRPGYELLLQNADVIVDGPFIQELHNDRLLYRGSANQRIIQVKPSLLTGRVVEWQFEATG